MGAPRVGLRENLMQKADGPGGPVHQRQWTLFAQDCAGFCKSQARMASPVKDAEMHQGAA